MQPDGQAGGSGGKGDGKPSKTQTTNPAATPSGSSETGNEKTVKKVEVDQASTTTTAASSTELVSEVTALLKSLRTNPGSEPKVRAMVMRAGVLLDSGATHCLRGPVNDEEWNAARDTKVQTATGWTTIRQLHGNGALLTKEPVQEIIPLGLLTQLGFRVQ